MNLISPVQKGSYLLRKGLSGNLVSITCFILAIIFKIALTYYFLQFDTDKIYQASAAKNFVEGHGLTIKQVHVNDLSAEKYEPLSGWPPGYSLLVAIFFKLFGNLELSCFAIDIIAILIFFIVLKKLLIEFKFPDYIINLILLFNGLIINDSITLSAPTDLLALGCCLCSLYLVMVAFNRNNSSLILAILIAVINVLPAFLRYMYIPASFVIPAFLLFTGLNRNKSLFRSGIIVLVITSLSIIFLLLFQNFYTGSSVYIRPSETGIFWSNLLLLHPVLFSAFFNLNFLFVQLSLFTGVSYSSWADAVRMINFPLFLCLAFLFFRHCLKTRLATNARWNIFFIVNGSINFCVLSVLAYLSLTYSRHYPPPQMFTWTYLSDGRYFIGIALFIVIFVAHWLFTNSPGPSSARRKGLQLLFVLVLAADIVHGIYFLSKNFTLNRHNNKVALSQNRLLNYLKAAIHKNNIEGREVVFSNHTYLMNQSVLHGGNGLFNREELNYETIYSKRPTLLIVPIEDYQFSYYQPFLSKKGVQLETKIANLYIFHCYIVPDDK